jgi:hypothetical protein
VSQKRWHRSTKSQGARTQNHTNRRENLKYNFNFVNGSLSYESYGRNITDEHMLCVLQDTTVHSKYAILNIMN